MKKLSDLLLQATASIHELQKDTYCAEERWRLLEIVRYSINVALLATLSLEEETGCNETP